MQHLNSPLKRRASTEIVDALTKSFIAAIVGSVALSSAFGSSVQAAIATKPTANVGAAFCRQIKASQTAIGKAARAGTPAVKPTAIGAEWTKIAATVPADIKSDVLIVRTAYTESAKAGIDAAAKAPAVATAGAKISSYFAQNCGGGGIAGAGVQDGVGEGGPGRGGFGNDSPERTAYRECLTKNGLNLPAPAVRACLTKKGVTLAPPAAAAGAGAAGGGAAGGGRPVLDAKTHAAFDVCQKEVG